MTLKELDTWRDQELRWLMTKNRRMSGQDKARYCPHCGALKTRQTILWCVLALTVCGFIRLLFS